MNEIPTLMFSSSAISFQYIIRTHQINSYLTGNYVDNFLWTDEGIRTEELYDDRILPQINGHFMIYIIFQYFIFKAWCLVLKNIWLI